MTTKAVIFDLDGTLASFNLDYMAVRAEVRGLLINRGVPASLLMTNESIFDMLKKVEIFLKNNGKPGRTFEKMRREVLLLAEKYEMEAAKTTSLIPGAVETLEELKRMGLKIGLCTINSEKSTSYILERFRIARFFDVIVPRDKVKYVKPNTEHLEAALHALRVDPDEALIIGDGRRDMQCASELGVTAVGFPTGLCTGKELTDSGAAYLIDMLTELPSLVQRLNDESTQ